MTCKNCVHKWTCKYINRIYGIDKICQYFKDKSLIIELPIKATEKLKEKLTKYCYERCVYEL